MVFFAPKFNHLFNHLLFNYLARRHIGSLAYWLDGTVTAQAIEPLSLAFAFPVNTTCETNNETL
jgi:hypothetical protein